MTPFDVTFFKWGMGSVSRSYDFRKDCSVRLYLQLFIGGLMSYLRYLYLFAHIDV